jgi:hypothetical protein
VDVMSTGSYVEPGEDGGDDADMVHRVGVMAIYHIDLMCPLRTSMQELREENDRQVTINNQQSTINNQQSTINNHKQSDVGSDTEWHKRDAQLNTAWRIISVFQQLASHLSRTMLHTCDTRVVTEVPTLKYIAEHGSRPIRPSQCQSHAPMSSKRRSLMRYKTLPGAHNHPSTARQHVHMSTSPYLPLALSLSTSLFFLSFMSRCSLSSLSACSSSLLAILLARSSSASTSDSPASISLEPSLSTSSYLLAAAPGRRNMDWMVAETSKGSREGERPGPGRGRLRGGEVEVEDDEVEGEEERPQPRCVWLWPRCWD